ncbi:MAG: hypothetical protein OEU36_05560 [Gammaproteobacteria bacterium]|nr:hypothetical protein [Gammaproteobacteria bacterium]
MPQIQRLWLEKYRRSVVDVTVYSGCAVGGNGSIEGRIGRIDTIAELRKHLGEPRTIVCLGNGPSAEHPALETI